MFFENNENLYIHFKNINVTADYFHDNSNAFKILFSLNTAYLVT